MELNDEILNLVDLRIHFFLFVAYYLMIRYKEGVVMFKIGDLVTRNSYNNDIVFKIMDIDNNLYVLKGIDVRLCADSPGDDLQAVSLNNLEVDDFTPEIEEYRTLDRDEYFYLPGSVLHLDTDTQLSNKAPNPYKIRENTNFKKYKKSQKKQKISNFS